MLGVRLEWGKKEESRVGPKQSLPTNHEACTYTLSPPLIQKSEIFICSLINPLLPCLSCLLKPKRKKLWFSSPVLHTQKSLKLDTSLATLTSWHLLGSSVLRLRQLARSLSVSFYTVITVLIFDSEIWDGLLKKRRFLVSDSVFGLIGLGFLIFKNRIPRIL